MIYTSYFGNMKHLDLSLCISIARVRPSWYKGKEYLAVAPTFDILNRWRAGNKDEEAKKLYIREYQKILDTLDVDEIKRELDGKILLCYEKCGVFCHRHLLAYWLNQHGIPCREWEDPCEVSLFEEYRL